jgi:hypothetical protein
MNEGYVIHVVNEEAVTEETVTESRKVKQLLQFIGTTNHLQARKRTSQSPCASDLRCT